MPPLHLFANDIFGGNPENVDFELLSTPGSDILEPTAEPGVFNFNFLPGSKNLYVFEYEICGVGCPKICDTARVEISKFPPGSPLPDLDPPPNVMTPNGDGTGDEFRIKNFDEIRSTRIELTILNRWGSVVFEDGNYKNDWKGTDQSGRRLPAGSYFYILKGGGGTKKGASGPITIVY